MILRRIAAVLFLPMMFAFGSGVYLYLGTLKSKVVKTRADLPTVTKPRLVLPGTMFVVQDGRLFKLKDGGFTEIGSAGDWSQPTLTPDHTHLVAVLRSGYSSDLYLLDLDGHIVKRLTKNDSRIVDYNHWAFYPRVSPDGSTLFYSYDGPKHVTNAPGDDLSIWSMPLNGSQSQARRRTDPYWYTGGDATPIPLAGTAVLYVQHSIDPSTAVHSQIRLQSRLGDLVGKPLTSLADNCSQPALSPDGTQLAMICTGGKQTARLEVASFNGTSLGPPRTLLDGGLYASPAWSPDGQALAYFAPSGAAGHFELWWLAVPVVATPTPTATATPTHSASAGGGASSIVVPSLPTTPVPVQVTQGVDLSATSPPAWY
ncbi:MAG: TolB protein [Chloroflexota bacterium]|nr:TolB protein [Chloroflexota bacterium]